MHTKGEAARKLKQSLGLDVCVYLGNDLNDITMFSNALDDNDFMVIARHENREITDMLIRALQEECKIKGIKWEDAKLLVLEEENVNSFLHKTNKLLGVLNSKKKPQGIRKTYRFNITRKADKVSSKSEKMPNKRKKKPILYR